MAKQKMTTLERVIKQREWGIKKMREEKRHIMESATERCADIDHRIRERTVILEALKSGQLSPRE